MIVVTGAAGFIGSNVIAELNDAGKDDVVACDFLGHDAKWRNLSKRLVRDIVPPSQIFDCLSRRQDVSAVIHLGANTSTLAQDGDEVMETNFRFSLRILDWCTERRTPLVYASSAATYGNGEAGFDDDWSLSALRKLRPLNLYGWSKQLFDLEVANRLEHGELLPPACVGLKFFNVYGPNEYHKGAMMSVLAKSFELARKGETIRLFKSYRDGISDGAQKRDFVYVRDVVDVILWFVARARDVGIFNVGSGEARSFADLIQAMFDAMRMEKRIVFIDMPDELKSQYQYFTQADLRRLRTLGYTKAPTKLEDGVADLIQRYLTTEDRFR